MLGLLAAALLAPTQSPAPPTSDPISSTAKNPAANSDVLESAAPWWEKITVTVDDQGKQQSCRYETNLRRAEACAEEMAASIKAGVKGQSGVFSKVTFERRFTPGVKPDADPMKPGDTLLGRQVMFLTIDAKGAIETCKLVSSSGDVPPDYGCAEAKKEQFRAHDSADGRARQAFMTVLAYGHTEQIA